MKFDDNRSSNIISLAAQRKNATFAALRQVEAYWEGLRNGRFLPERGDVDPRGMQSVLEYAFVLERIAPGVARFRLAGMHLNELMGMEVRGMPLTAMFTPASRKSLSEALESVFETPQVTTITLKGERTIGRGPLEAQMLLCPLKSDLGDVNRVLGCLQSQGPTGRQPRRFNIEKVSSRPLLTNGQPLKPKVKAPKVMQDALKASSTHAGTDEGVTERGTPIPAGFREARKAFLDQVKSEKISTTTLTSKTSGTASASSVKPKSAPKLWLVKSDT